ncbi:hypothetical protein D9599_21315 [Roseomonas sp. KE2513]|uniref:hypothetical protein n=1 Tax=Roseomonas sp. KE2513 TaxID=2479202 RepID=UPI0018DF73D2|nr:hypothetical protein [Roseomonas sp. KE2513]MBI0538106.1 hypothetical protein [Roseomonas sp. KE2513]
MASAERQALLDRVCARISELEAKPQLRSEERHELALRRALIRLVNGVPLHTDGALTGENLYAEARVARATMYRIRSVMDDWKAAQNAVAPDSPAALREQIRSLKAQLRKVGEERSEERQRLVQIQAVLVQRVQALTLALVEARGGAKVTDLGLLRRQKGQKSGGE